MLAEAAVAFDDELQRRLGSAVPGRTLRQFRATLTRLRAAGHRIGIEHSVERPRGMATTAAGAVG